MMGAKPVAMPLVGAAVVLVLAGCSSTTSSPKAAGLPAVSTSAASASSAPATTASAVAPSTAVSTSSQVASTSASTSDASATTGHDVSDMVGTSGHISAGNAPTAKPEWVARLKSTDIGGDQIDAKNLNLIALVDEAAREHDLTGLVRLSNDQLTQAQLSQPGVLDELVAVLEKTHAAATDGYTYPGFKFAGADSATGAADLRALGVSSATGYKGVHVVFGDGGHGLPLTWDVLMSS